MRLRIFPWANSICIWKEGIQSSPPRATLCRLHLPKVLSIRSLGSILVHLVLYSWKGFLLLFRSISSFFRSCVTPDVNLCLHYDFTPISLFSGHPLLVHSVIKDILRKPVSPVSIKTENLIQSGILDLKRNILDWVNYYLLWLWKKKNDFLSTTLSCLDRLAREKKKNNKCCWLSWLAYTRP